MAHVGEKLRLESGCLYGLITSISKLLRQPVALRYVSRKCIEPETASDLHRADRELDREFIPISVNHIDRELLVEKWDFTRCLQGLQSLSVILTLLLGDNGLSKRAADRFRTRPSEYSLGLFVPVRYYTAAVHGDEGFADCIEGKSRLLLQLS